MMILLTLFSLLPTSVYAASVDEKGFELPPTISKDSNRTLPPMVPLIQTPLRDPSVCTGPEKTYYLTGTTGYPTWWETNEGIEVWESTDLKVWIPLGRVWSFEKDATWQRPLIDRKQALWAPEIHYLKGTFWLTYSINTGGTGLLKSVSGKAEGPYEDVKKDGPLTPGIDASLFEDVDGKVYFIWQNGMIAPVKEDMSGLAGEGHLLTPSNHNQVGFEGAFLTRSRGKYILSCADFIGEEYSCLSACSDTLQGPYGERYISVRHGGHNMFFMDFEGNYWSTFFGNDPGAPFRERFSLLPVSINPDGKIRPVY